MKEKNFSIKKFLLVFFLFLFFALPIFAQNLELNYPESFGEEPTTLPKYITYIFNLACGLGAFATIFMIIWGGVKRMRALGDPQKIRDATDQIKKALLGFLLLLLVYVVLATINPDLAMIKLPNLSFLPSSPPTPPPEQEVPEVMPPVKIVPEPITGGGKTVYDLLTNTREVENNAIQPISNLADFPNKCSCSYCNTHSCGCGDCVCSGGTYRDVCPMPDIQDKIDEIKEVIIPGLKASRDGIQKLQEDADYYFAQKETYFVDQCQEIIYWRLKYICGMEIKDPSCLSECISNCGRDENCEDGCKNYCAEDCTFGEYFYLNPSNFQDCYFIAYGSPKTQQMEKEELIQSSITQKKEYLFGETLEPQKEELFNEVLKRQKEELIKEVQDQANQTIGEINKQKDGLIQEIKKQIEEKRNQITEEVKKQLEKELSVGPLLEEQQYHVILNSIENQKDQLIQDILNDQKNKLEKQLEDQKNRLLSQAKEPLDIKDQLNQLLKGQNTQLIGDLGKQQNRLIQLTDSLEEKKDQLIFAIETMEAAIKAINDIIDLIDRCDCGTKPCTSTCQYPASHGCKSGSCSCPGYPCPRDEWNKVKSEAQKARDAMQEKVNNLKEIKEGIEHCEAVEKGVLACEDEIAIGNLKEGECKSLDIFCQGNY